MQYHTLLWSALTIEFQFTYMMLNDLLSTLNALWHCSALPITRMLNVITFGGFVLLSCISDIWFWSLWCRVNITECFSNFVIKPFVCLQWDLTLDGVCFMHSTNTKKQFPVNWVRELATGSQWSPWPSFTLSSIWVDLCPTSSHLP